MNTYTAIISVFLTLVLTFFSARVAEADVWVCPQANGSVLYTNQPQDAGCQKFEPESQLIYLPPPSVSENPPQPDAGYDTQEADEPVVQMRSPEEEQSVVPSYAGERNDAQQDSFWTWDDNRQYIAVYTYVPGFYGISPSRPRHHIPRFRQGSPGIPRRDFRQNSVQKGVQTAPPRSVAPIPSDPRPQVERLGRGPAPTPLESVSPNGSRQSGNTPDRAANQTSRPQSPRVSQQMKRIP